MIGFFTLQISLFLDDDTRLDVAQANDFSRK